MRSVQIEGGDRGAPVVGIAIGPGRRHRLDPIQDDVLSTVRARGEPSLVVRPGNRSVVYITGGVHHPNPPAHDRTSLTLGSVVPFGTGPVVRSLTALPPPARDCPDYCADRSTPPTARRGSTAARSPR